MTARPPVIDEFWHSIDWDVEAIWALDLPSEDFPIAQLAWHSNVPVWPFDGRAYAVTPNQVLVRRLVRRAELERQRFPLTLPRLRRGPLPLPKERGIRGGLWFPSPWGEGGGRGEAVGG